MSERVFRKKDGQLVELDVEEYMDEKELQELVANKPSLIIPKDAHYKLLLIGTEMGIPERFEGSNRWSLDHLFVDNDAIPTLVEVKQSSNSEIYRKVVGQMIDYAANGSKHWTIDSIRVKLKTRLEKAGEDYSETLKNFIGVNKNFSDFWKQVHSNLRSGNIRLVFVADEIPSELTATIEFLEKYLNGIETFGVSIKKHKTDLYITTFTRLEHDLEATNTNNSRRKQWDKDTFFNDLEERNDSDISNIVKNIFEWNIQNKLEEYYGYGEKDGSYRPHYQLEKDWYCPVIFWTYGRVNIQFERLKTQTGFQSENERLEMLEKINAIPDVDISENRIDGRPSFRIETLQKKNSYNKFIEFLEWFVEKVKSIEESSEE